MAEPTREMSVGGKLLVAAAVAVAVLLVGWLDTVTGLRPDVTVLYLVPIGLATYAFGLWPGLGVAAVAAAAEILSHPGGGRFSETALVADAFTHLAVFILAAVVVDRLLVQLREIRQLESRRDFDLAVARDVYETTLAQAVTERTDLAVGSRQAFAFELGGDYLHLSDTSDGLFVAIGDISGKGVAAALFTVTLHQEVLEALHVSTDPADVVCSVNRRLFVATPGQMFVTLFCALIADDEFRYVNAGHEPGLLLVPGEPVRRLLSENTLPLGIEAEVEAEALRAPFPAGAVLLAVTDGISESVSMQPDPYGRLAALLEARSRVSAQEVADTVFAAARPPKGAAQRDDMTVLCVRHLG